MAPPSSVDSKQPAPVPAPPAADPAPAAKAEAKGSVSADVKVPPVAATEDSKEPRRVIDWGSWSAYTLTPEIGYGWQNFQNKQGMDHKGFNFRLTAGLQLRLGDRGQHVVKLPFAFDYQNLSKDEGANVTSGAKVYSYLIAPSYSYEVNDWFAPHVGLEFGLAHYSAPEGNGFDPVKMTLDQQGAEINKNPMLLPMSDNGFHAGIGLGACFIHQIACLNGRIFKNFSVDPQPADGFVDQPAGGYPAAGFSPLGLQIGLGVDVMAIIDKATSKKKPAVAQPAEDKAAPAASPAAPAGADKAKGASAAPTGAAAVPAAAPAKKPQTVTELFAETAGAATTAKEAADTNGKRLKDLKAELGKSEPDKDNAWFYVTDSIGQSKKATSAVSAAKSAVLSLELSAEGTGDEAKEAKAKLPEARKNLAKATADANKAYADAKAAHEAYTKKKLDGAKDVKFDAEKPQAAPKAAAPTGGPNKAAHKAPPAASKAPPKAPPKAGGKDEGIDGL